MDDKTCSPASTGGFCIRQVQLRTPSLKRMEDFYTGTLGMTRCSAEPGGRSTALGFAPESALVLLTEDPEAQVDSGSSCGLHHIAFQYPSRLDLSHALNGIARRNHPITGATHHGIAESIYISDPDGNGLELFHLVDDDAGRNRPDRSLDLSNLLLMGGAVTQPVKPPLETRLDHIHLQVSHLESAERFFHECLGFRIRTRVPGAIFLTTSGSHHQIAVNTWNRYGFRHPACAGLAGYRLASEPETLNRLRERAPTLGYDVHEIQTQAGREAIALRDPNNITLEVESFD